MNNCKPMKSEESVESLDKIYYIPPVCGTCENCKNETICKYKDELKQLEGKTKPYSRADRPYRIKIRCNHFENKIFSNIKHFDIVDDIGGVVAKDQTSTLKEHLISKGLINRISGGVSNE